METLRRSLLILPLLFLTWPLECGREKAFDSRRAHEWVEALASDELEGRRTGTPGGDEAARLVVEGFREAGLEPAGDLGSYLHRFTFPSYRLVLPARLTVEGIDESEGGEVSPTIPNAAHGLATPSELVYGRDFYFLNGSSTTSGTAEVVFAGYGISTPELDELAGIDVRGKVVLALQGLPPGAALDRSLAANINKARRVRELGAAGVLFFGNPERGSTFPEMRVWVFRPRNYLPGFFLAKIDLSVAQTLLGGRAEEKAKEAANGSSRPFATGKRLGWQVTVDYVPEQGGANVLGMIRGHDSELARELVLIGAHYDGGGVDPDGTIYNGAEDNASGTATVIEVAKVLAAGPPPARSLLFAAWGAEEQGAWGSKRFVEENRWPLDAIVLTLNLDNVGVGDGRFFLYGANNFPEQLRLLQHRIPASLMQPFTPRGAGGSDGWTFQVLGIPTFFAHADAPQPNVHTPNDDAGTISEQMLDTVGRFATRALFEAASAPATAYDPRGRLATYLWRYGFAIGTLDPAGATPDWRALRSQGYDLLIVRAAEDDGRASALRASLPPEVKEVHHRGDLADTEEGADLRVLFADELDTSLWEDVLEIGADPELPEKLLDPTADVAVVFDVQAARPLDFIARLLDEGIDGERIEDLMDGLRSQLVKEMPE